jgi:hypothetical protein
MAAVQHEADIRVEKVTCHRVKAALKAPRQQVIFNCVSVFALVSQSTIDLDVSFPKTMSIIRGYATGIIICSS